MSHPTVYIAGPDLFFRETWPAHVARVESLCAPLGLTPIFPVPAAPITGPGVTKDGDRHRALAVAEAALIADVRRRVSSLLGLDAGYLTPESARARYAELMARGAPQTELAFLARDL